MGFGARGDASDRDVAVPALDCDIVLSFGESDIPGSWALADETSARSSSST